MIAVNKRKNILFLMTDQHRADYVGFHDSGKLRTPNIDRIAEGVGFTNCVSVNPVCMPARSALLTGKYTHQIGALGMSGDLSLQHPTYLQALQRSGYHTSGIGKLHWLQGWPFQGKGTGRGHDLVRLEESTKQFGLDYVWEAAGKQLALQNYCHYAEHLDRKGLLEPYRQFIRDCGRNVTTAKEQQFKVEPFPFAQQDYIDAVIGDKIVERIRERPKDRPFFIFGSFASPHPPYDPPAVYLRRIREERADDFVPDNGAALPEDKKEELFRLRRAYKAMITLVDDQIGRIFEVLEREKLLEDTVILFAADHGEMMGDHGRVQKMSPYWQSVGVPAAIRHPDRLRGTVNHSPIEIIDLTATMLEIADIDPQEALSLAWPEFNHIVPAKSLLPIVTGQRDSIREFAFSEWGARWEMIQSERWKYIRYFNRPDGQAPYEELFDRVEDPNEQINRIHDPGLSNVAEWHRSKRQQVMDETPPAQLRWAPLMQAMD